jgi:hypothetical protein
MNPPPPSWVPFVAAAATLIAALVALFKEDVVKKWRCPNLSLRTRISMVESAFETRDKHLTTV